MSPIRLWCLLVNPICKKWCLNGCISNNGKVLFTPTLGNNKITRASYSTVVSRKTFKRVDFFFFACLRFREANPLICRWTHLSQTALRYADNISYAKFASCSMLRVTGDETRGVGLSVSSEEHEVLVTTVSHDRLPPGNDMHRLLDIWEQVNREYPLAFHTLSTTHKNAPLDGLTVVKWPLCQSCVCVAGAVYQNSSSVLNSLQTPAVKTKIY